MNMKQIRPPDPGRSRSKIFDCPRNMAARTLPRDPFPPSRAKNIVQHLGLNTWFLVRTGIDDCWGPDGPDGTETPSKYKAEIKNKTTQNRKVTFSLLDSL